MFNIIIACFMGFIGLFSNVLLPHTMTIHPIAACEALLEVLPSGFAGSVAVVHNWSYSLFYCFSELWGDVCLSLLFWSLANEITSLKDAAVIYPLFGIGANVAQVCAGQVLKAAGMGAEATGYVPQMQALCTLVLGLGALVIFLHEVVCKRMSVASHKKDDGQSAGGPDLNEGENKRQNNFKRLSMNITASGKASSHSVEMRISQSASSDDGMSGAPVIETPAQEYQHQPMKKQSHKDAQKRGMSFREALRCASARYMVSFHTCFVVHFPCCTLSVWVHS